MSTIGGNFPDEIIREILLRLPTKPLGRFKSVSKYWRELISDPKFAKTHLTLNNRRRPKLLLSDNQFFNVVDIDGEPYVSSSNIDFNQTHQWISLYGSCDGLILAVAENLAENYELFLLNPTTQECKKLPNPKKVDSDGSLAFGFGYDSTSDDYKVVVSFTDSGVANVYSLRSDAWKIVQVSPFNNDVYISERCSGIYLNDSIHWVCFLPSSVSVIAFDLSDEKFKNVPPPRELSQVANQAPNVSLYEVSGYLCLLNEYDTGVWVMKDYGVELSWAKFGGVETWDGDLVVNQLFDNHVHPVFYLPDKELVIIHDEIHGIRIDSNNVIEKTSRNVIFHLKHDYMCKFLDSLVSPEQFNRRTTTFLH